MLPNEFKICINLEQPLVVYPELAKFLGLNEAIIFQQLHYWLTNNQKAQQNYKQGRFWCFQTLSQWQEQFPFFSIDTIKRAFKNLHQRGFIFKENLNTNKQVQTMWYSIDYEKFVKSFNEACQLRCANCTSGGCKMHNWEVQNAQMYNIEENNKENNEETNKKSCAVGKVLPTAGALANAQDISTLKCKTVTVDLPNSTVGSTVYSVKNVLTNSSTRGRAGAGAGVRASKQGGTTPKTQKARLNELYDKIDEDDRFTNSVKELLKEWVASREELGQKVSTIALTKNLNVIGNLNPDGQIRSVTEAIKKGWRGLFVVKQGVYTNQRSKASINASQVPNSAFDEEAEMVNSFRCKTKQEEEEEHRKMILEMLETDSDRQNLKNV